MVTTTQDAKTFAIDGKTPSPNTKIFKSPQFVVEVMIALSP